MKRGFSILPGLALAALLLAAPARHARADEARYAVISAFLYNFLLFTDWPADKTLDQGPFLIGVLGRNPFERAAAAIEQRQAGGRSIAFLHFPALADVRPTHLLFVADADAADMPAIRKASAKHPVLLVGDSERFTRRGGMIRFYEEGAGKEKAMRVEINKTAADLARIRFRSQLMRLAQIVTHPVPAD